VNCTFKGGTPFSGEYIKYDVSNSSIELESIEEYKDGELWYHTIFEDKYLEGTYCDSKTEIINDEEIITRFVNGTEFL